MDIGLPGIDGIEATRRLQTIRPGLPVIMLTAYDDDHVVKAVEAGARGYVVKSCTPEQLIGDIYAAHRGLTPIDPAVTTELVREVRELRHQRRALLSPRQTEILQLVVAGTAYQDIATKLFISLSTVNREMRAIFDRLGVSDAVQAVSEAYKKGLITDTRTGA